MWNGRLDSPLFNIRQYARDMEVVYAKMWNRYSNNLAADHIMSWLPCSSVGQVEYTRDWRVISWLSQWQCNCWRLKRPKVPDNPKLMEKRTQDPVQDMKYKPIVYKLFLNKCNVSAWAKNHGMLNFEELYVLGGAINKYMRCAEASFAVPLSLHNYITIFI